MGDWIEIEGTVDIYKKDKVSIKQVIEETLGDEFSLELDTKVFPDYYRHKFSISISIDGEDFIKHREAFFKALKPKKQGMSITATLSFWA